MAARPSPGRVLPQEELLRRVWGPGYAGESGVLPTTIRRLRRKIEPDPGAPRYVLTHRALGYLLAAPRSPTSAGDAHPA